MKNLILKIIAAVSFGMIGFPLMLGVDVNRYGNISVIRVLLYYAVLFAVFGLGCLCTAFVKNIGVKPKKEAVLRALERVFGCLTFFAGFTALLFGGDAATVMTLGGYCIFAFFLGERFMYKNFTDMFPLSAFAFYLVFATGSYFFTQISLPEELVGTVSGIVVASFCAQLVIAGLLVNQSGISVKANMRKETKSSLPKGLTAYNAALILGISIAALSLVTLSGHIAWLLQQGFIIIIKALVFFVSLFNAEKIPLEQSEGDGSISGELEAQPNYIWQAIGIIILLALAVKFRKKIFEAIKNVFLRLGRWLSTKPEESEVPEFTDRFENYSNGRKKRGRSFSYYALSALYKTERDPIKKFRYGYGILLCKIKSRNHTLTVYDTVEEQTKKGGKYFDPEKLSRVAHSYNAVRYGETAPTESETAELDEIIS